MKEPMTHAALVDIAYRWVLRTARCGFAFKEMVCLSSEQPDVIGFGGKVNSLLVECKVSRSDFLADAKKFFRLYPEQGMGGHRIYCAPEGLLKLEELPEKWALLSVDEKQRCTLSFRPAPEWPGAGFLTPWHHQPHNEKNERAVMYSALRRMQHMGLVPESFKGQPITANKA